MMEFFPIHGGTGHERIRQVKEVRKRKPINRLQREQSAPRHVIDRRIGHNVGPEASLGFADISDEGPPPDSSRNKLN
jgi:hypothetical protein